MTLERLGEPYQFEPRSSEQYASVFRPVRWMRPRDALSLGLFRHRRFAENHCQDSAHLQPQNSQYGHSDATGRPETDERGHLRRRE